jgi:hypothetical protein
MTISNLKWKDLLSRKVEELFPDGTRTALRGYGPIFQTYYDVWRVKNETRIVPRGEESMTTDAEYKLRCGKDGHPHYYKPGDVMCLCGETVTKPPECGDRGGDYHVFSLPEFESGKRSCNCGKTEWEGKNPFKFDIGDQVEVG